MKKPKKRIILLIITLIFLYFVSVNLDLTELLAVIKKFNLWYILPLSISIVVSLSIRGIVFKQLLYNTVKPPLIELSHLCISAAAMNIVLPARAGDIFRAWFIGDKYNIDKIKVFGTVMFERIFDIIVIFMFLLTGLFIYNANQIARNLCLVAGLFMVLGIAIVLYAYKYNQTDNICNFIIRKTEKLPFSHIIKNIVRFLNQSCNSFFKGFEIIENPKHMLFAIIASFGVWFFECLNFYIVMKGFGCEIDWSVTLFLISFIALACMVPSTSIFIGPYQMAVIAAFGMYNVNKETALAISIVDQTTVLIVTSIAALIFLFKNNISYKQLKSTTQ